MEIKRIRSDIEGMTFHKENEVVWTSFPEFDRVAWLTNAFSTRIGGVSEGIFASMNLGFSLESEHPERVAENFRRFSAAVGFEPEHMVHTQQEHKDRILRVGRNERGAGFAFPRPWTEVDGLVTNEPDVVLTIFGADCVPIFLADVAHKAIGAVHAGWRGTDLGIAGKAVRMMREEFDSDPVDMIAGIGPSICGECYEVSGEVACRFPAECVRPKANGKFMLDLHRANFLILEEAGIPAGKIFPGNLCTACNPDIFFSHRATHGQRGVCAGFLMIKGTA